MRHRAIAIGIASGLAVIVSCSARAVYNDQELALAQQGVDQFHDYYNRKDYDALYALMSADARRAKPMAVVLPAMQAAVGQWGREESAVLLVAKVLPGPPIQVRMIYNSTYENGKAQEWFIWTSDGKRASLLQYQIIPDWPDPSATKNATSQ